MKVTRNSPQQRLTFWMQTERMRWHPINKRDQKTESLFLIFNKRWFQMKCLLDHLIKFPRLMKINVVWLIDPDQANELIQNQNLLYIQSIDETHLKLFSTRIVFIWKALLIRKLNLRFIPNFEIWRLHMLKCYRRLKNLNQNQ